MSNQLAEQVLDALWELLRGFQAADAQRYDQARENEKEHEGGLQALAKKDPQHIYGGLLTTLMRLVFLLYAEDRGLMPDDSVYQRNYSVSGLYEKPAIPNSNLQTYVLPQQGTKLLGFSRSDLLVEFDHDQKRTVAQGF